MNRARVALPWEGLDCIFLTTEAPTSQSLLSRSTFSSSVENCFTDNTGVKRTTSRAATDLQAKNSMSLNQSRVLGIERVRTDSRNIY